MDDLNKRVLLLIDKLGITKTVFASALDVSQAVITHISSGRNKPGVEILQKILQAYPHISAEWLLMGTGEMEKKGGFNRDTMYQSLQLAETRLQNSLFDLRAIHEILNEQKEKLK